MRSQESEFRIQRIIEKIRASHSAEDADDAPDLSDEDPEDELAMLPLLLSDIENNVGGDLLDILDPELLADFCMMTITRNEGTGQLLRSLLEAFMRAYSGFDTSDRSVQALVFLQGLATASDPKLN